MIEGEADALVISAIDALGAWHHGDSHPHYAVSGRRGPRRGSARSRPLVLIPARY